MAAPGPSRPELPELTGARSLTSLIAGLLIVLVAWSPVLMGGGRVGRVAAPTAYDGSGQQVNQASWYYDAAGNQTGNSGYPGTSQPLAITYNQHDQTTSITDAYQHPVAMAWTGPGQAERTSADWSNQPSPVAGQPAEYGHTTYTNAALGVMSQTNSNGTTYYTRDPGGLPVSERKGTSSYYYLLDGAGNVAILMDPPSDEPAAIA